MNLMGMVHGDDFVFTGSASALEGVHKDLSKTVLLKLVGVLGSGKDDSKELRVLNRVIRHCPDGIRYEADPRHSEILRALLVQPAHVVGTPGVKPHSGALPGPRAGVTTVGREAPTDNRVFTLEGGHSSEGAAWGSGDEAEEHGETLRSPSRRPGRRERAEHREQEDNDWEPSDDDLLDGERVGLFRAAAARANYLALGRPDLGFPAKELCRRLSAS